jgi:hypothetical protein
VNRRAFCLILLALLPLTGRAFSQDSNPPIYSEAIPTSSGLPFDPVTDHRESFRAPNGQRVEALVKGPVGSGVYSRPIRNGETPDDYFPAVVDEAVKAGAHHLVIPNGKYIFHGPKLCTDASPACNQPTSCNANLYYNCQPHWTIGQYPQGQVKEPDSVTDLDIDFSGSELDFSAPVIGLWILQTQRLRLRNVTIDWPELPIASLGTIVADPDNPGHNALVIDKRYPVTDRYQEGGRVQIQAVDIWDESREDPPGYFDAKSNNTYETYFIFGNAPQPTYVGKTSAGAQTFSCKSCHFQNSPADPTCSFFNGCANFDGFTPGTRVIVRHYTYNGFAVLVNWSNDIDFENVKLRTGPGIGFSVSSNGGYRGFRLADSQVARGPGRILSTASDAVDVTEQADIIIKHNNIGYQGDDSLSIYPTTSTITGVNGKEVAIPAVCSPDPMDQPIAGDTLAFFDTNYIYKATARVVAAKGAFCGTTLTLTLDRAVSGLNASDNLLDLTQQGSARYVVRDNTMHECRCHGVLVDAPYGSIDHNTMFRNSQGAIQLAGGNEFGPGSTNLSIRENFMSLSGQSTQYYGAVTLLATDVNGNILPSAAFEKIKIDGNLIGDTPGPGILTTSTRYFSMDRNWLVGTNQIQSAPLSFGDLTSLDSLLVYQSSDGTLCDNHRLRRTTGAIGIDPSDHAVTVDPDCR